MPIGWIASRDVSAFVVEAIYNSSLKSDSFQISGLENLKGNALAEQFSKGVGVEISYYEQPAKEFGEILKPWVGEEGATGVASYYEGLQNATEYPPKYNPAMEEVLKKLPVKMTSVQDWAKMNREIFLG